VLHETFLTGTVIFFIHAVPVLCFFVLREYGLTGFTAALKALQAVRTPSPLVQQCQKALNDISTQHAVGLYWVPGHARVRGSE
jgi:hypothetical protein